MEKNESKIEIYNVCTMNILLYDMIIGIGIIEMTTGRPKLNSPQIRNINIT